jgi:putative drug exporter of the RND superfamily
MDADKRTNSSHVPSGFLANATRHFATHPKRTVGTWVLVIAALVFLNGVVGGKLIDDFKLPGSDFQKATDLLNAKFGAEKGDSLQLVFAAPEGQRLDTPARTAAIAKVVAAAKDTPHVTSVENPLSKRFLAKDGRIAYTDIQFDQLGPDIKRANVVAIQDKAKAAGEQTGMQVAWQGGADVQPAQQGASELIGYLFAFVVMLIVFRTFVATFIPISLAIISVFCAFMLLYLAAAVTNINTVTEILVPMIGIGVGIDYSLFIVTRFRQALHDGLPPREAAAYAGATAGRAVIFAGLTVAISITGLVFIGIDFITKLGLGSALGVLTSVALATTLLPAVLAMLGHKVDRWRVPFLRGIDDSEQGRQHTLIARWGRFVSRHALAMLIASLCFIALLAAPALGVNLGLADAGTAPKGSVYRTSYDLLAEGFGPGFNGPVPIVVDQPNTPDAAKRIRARLHGLSGIARINPTLTNKAGDVALINVIPSTSPQSQATNNLVKRIRDHVVPTALAGTSAQAYVSGQTAAFKEIGDIILSRMPYFLLYIIGVTFIVLAMAFRSVVIAAKAAITTILSAFVGFGLLTFMVQMGHGIGLLGLDRTGPIESFVPPIAFAILFGLSMDYEVFLMSRIREEHVRGKPTTLAVTDGVAAIGRVVVAAACIMSVVFAAFILQNDRIPKEFGLLLAVAILNDALVVRLTLVPALLTLLRERSWMMPRWLDKVLPRITIEAPTDGEERVEARPAGALGGR